MDETIIKEAEIETSPVPQEEEITRLTFPEAIEQATNGKNIRREAWPEGEVAYFKGFQDGEFLCIFTKGEEHLWTISKGDACEIDWIAY